MKTEADIRGAMQGLSHHTLQGLYEDAFNQISCSGTHAQNCAVQILSLLLCIQEPLAPVALIQATVSADAEQNNAMTLARLLDITFGLVVHDEELNAMRFSHVSFQEFLQTKETFSSHKNHERAAHMCLDICLKGLPLEIEGRESSKDRFYHYCAIYWAEHCRIATKNTEDEVLSAKLKAFVFDDDDVSLSFITWLEDTQKLIENLAHDHRLMRHLKSSLNKQNQPLFLACVFGLNLIIRYLHSTQRLDCEQKNDLGQNALYLAAATGHSVVVKILLISNAQVGTVGGRFGYPLHAACFYGHMDTVRTLLNYEADPKLGSKSALEYAILAGHESVARLLLDGYFQIVDQSEYDTILQRAAETGLADIILLLQKKYDSVYDTLGSPGCRAIELAILKGRTGVVEKYLHKLANPALEMPKGSISTAALGGHNSIIQLLTDRGLNISEEGTLGTPLRAACIMCHEATVRLLLSLGVSPTTSESLGEPLHAAAMRGHEAVIQLLITHNADLNSQGGIYGTAIQAAAHRGHKKVVEILLDAGARVYQNGFSRDALHAASEGGHEGIVQMLIEKGFEFRTSPNYRAQYRKSYPPKELLRDTSPSRVKRKGVDISNKSKKKDWSPTASICDPFAAFQQVQSARISQTERLESYNNNARDGNYALCAAAANGHLGVVKFLMNQKEEMWTSEVTDAFKEACKYGHRMVVEHILLHKIESETLAAGFKVAALNGHLGVLNILIDHETRLGPSRVTILEIDVPDSNKKASSCSDGTIVKTSDLRHVHKVSSSALRQSN